MNKHNTLLLSALMAGTVFSGTQLQADNMASIAIAPATGVVTLVPRWSIGGNLAGFHEMAQDTGFSVGANNFYSIKNTTIPAGGDIAAFTYYIAGSGSATNLADVGSKLTPAAYSALTSADPDIGFGAVNFYFIHHKGTTDYFSVIVPGSGLSSAVTDLKPMSGPGGPATVTNVSGYFGLTFAAANLGYGLNLFYYFRADPVTGFTKFGTLTPALLGSSADLFDLGISGHNALTFTGTDVGYGVNQLYFNRLDPITGFTILGTLNPLTGKPSDIANLGSVYSTLDYVPGDVGFGAGDFYTTGAVNPTWQSVSFAAIADRAIVTGPFNVTPTASSALPIVLTVVPGSVGAASIVNAGGGVFTVTPVAPGLITLQATQAGQSAPLAPVYEYNMLRQSFTISGVALLQITTQPTSQTAVTGTTANFAVVAAGTSTLSYQWRKAGVNIAGNASATTANLALTNAQAADVASYDVAVTNASGTIFSNAVTLTVTTAAPIITNSPLTAAGTVGTAFSFTITASSSPTSYSASPLPPGVTVNTATGAITGTPSTAGSTSVLLGATNATGTGNATLTITIAAAGVAPVITNSPLTAAGTVGTPFSFTITATGTPTSYSASPLPAGLSIVAATGAITGTPTAVGTTSVLLGATNATGTGNATLTITVAAAGVAPVITNSPLTAAGTVGTPFSFAITATGTPTSYSATPLPAGLVRNAATGVITGTPTAVGVTAVTLGATNSFGTGSATLTITIAAAGVAPVITNSPLTAAGTVGTPFSFTITATGTPASYSATPLPAGVVVNTTTGALTGTPTAGGSTSVLLGATNATGTGSATLTVTIAALPSAPSINNSPLTAAGTVGTPFSFAITATGAPVSFAASPLPAGLTFNATTGFITGTPTTVGTTSVQLGATNPLGTGNATFTITITAALLAPVVTLQPVSQTVTAGQSTNFTVAGDGDRDPSETFYWQRLPFGSTTWLNLFEGGSYHGVTTATMTVSTPTPAMSGDQFRSVIVNATDFTVSNPVTLTVAGGTDFLFQYPAGLAQDGSGSLYVADTFGDTILKVTSAGIVSTLAGSAGQAGTSDGTGSAARFNHPDSVAVDAAGNVYVTDTGNATVRKITPAGVVTTLAGTAGMPGSADGSGSAASFRSPTGIALDATGNLYVSDTGSATIRKITSAGAVSTLAGTAGSQGSADGTGAAARFSEPHGLTVDSAGNVYVADTKNDTIRKITSGGVVTTMAGKAGVAGFADGLGATARFNQPYGVAVDSTGNVYVADTGNDTLRAITPGGATVTLAGMAGVAGLNDGAGGSAQFDLPHALVVNAGSLYVADTGNSTLRLISPTDTVSTPTVSAASTAGATGGTVTPPAGNTTTGSGGGGGGAIEPWFLALLALLGAARWRAKAAGRNGST